MLRAMNEAVADRKLPGTLLFLGIVAFLLGGLGLLSAAMGFFGAIVQQQQLAAMAAHGSSDPMAAAVTEPMIALASRSFVPSLLANTALGIAALTLIAGGVLAVIRHPTAPTLGAGLLGATVALWVAATGLELWVQHLSMEMMTSMMSGLGDSDPSFGAAAGPMMDQWIGIGAAFSYGCAGIWLLVKGGFAIWAALHLRSAALAPHFSARRALDARGD